MNVITTKPRSVPQEQLPGFGLVLGHTHQLTTEYLLAYETGSFEAFCRMQCGLCRSFVSRLKTPIEFRALKAFFPFIRLASVLEIPRTQDNLPTWLELAFQAGLQLGHTQPEALDEILPDHVLHKARGSLLTLQKLAGDSGTGARELQRLFALLAERQWPQINPAEMDQVYCETAVRALRAGFMTATVGPIDPGVGEFCSDLTCASPGATDLVRSVLIDACAFEWNLALAYRMEHPLLRLARQLHRDDAVRQDELLERVDAALRVGRVYSEIEDPDSIINPTDLTATSPTEPSAPFRGRRLEHILRALDSQTGILVHNDETVSGNQH